MSPVATANTPALLGRRTSGRRHRHLPFLTTYGRGSPRSLSGYRYAGTDSARRNHLRAGSRHFPCAWPHIAPSALAHLPDRKSQSLIGHNGSGKSTLLKMLGRHQPPSAGEVLLDGQPLESWGSKAFARKVAYLPQQLPPAEGMTVRGAGGDRPLSMARRAGSLWRSGS